MLAHPDDETFMIGGTAARLAGAGHRVGLVCATRGQAGSPGEPPLATRDELPALRERELREACALLGIAPVLLLDHEDRHLAEADPATMRAHLVRVLRTERPAVVVTFDPAGLNGHPDHVAIGRFALDAVTAAADPRYAPELGDAHRVRRVVWPAPVLPADEWRPAVLAEHWGVDYLVDVAAVRDRKTAALRAHRSQHRSVDRVWLGEPLARSAGAVLDVEVFRHGWGEAPTQRPADDLFAGLDDLTSVAGDSGVGPRP